MNNYRSDAVSKFWANIRILFWKWFLVRLILLYIVILGNGGGQFYYLREIKKIHPPTSTSSLVEYFIPMTMNSYLFYQFPKIWSNERSIKFLKIYSWSGWELVGIPSCLFDAKNDQSSTSFNIKNLHSAEHAQRPYLKSSTYIHLKAVTHLL